MKTHSVGFFFKLPTIIDTVRTSKWVGSLQQVHLYILDCPLLRIHDICNGITRSSSKHFACCPASNKHFECIYMLMKSNFVRRQREWFTGHLQQTTSSNRLGHIGSRNQRGIPVCHWCHISCLLLLILYLVLVIGSIPSTWHRCHTYSLSSISCSMLHWCNYLCFSFIGPSLLG